MDNKTRPFHMLSTRDSLHIKNTHRLKVKEWKKTFHENGNKKAEVAILIPYKIDSKTKAIARDK